MQTVIRFNTGEPSGTTGQWRSTVEAAVGLKSNDPAWLSVRTVQTQTALWFIAGNPSASDLLQNSYATLARGVVERLGKAIPFEILARKVALRRANYLVDYRVPKLIVSKSGPEWGDFNAETLSDEAKRKLQDRISQQIARQAEAWGLALPDNGVPVTLVEGGRPLPIMQAIEAGRSGSAKGRAALARAPVTFTSLWELEGEWQFGPLGALGFGRAYRTYAAGALWDKALAEMLQADEEYA
jgi:hypothetical protein